MRRVIGKTQTFGSGDTPAPAVQVYLYIERINHGEWIDFMIDTGAGGTCLHGSYAFDLQDRLRSRTLKPYGGIAGISCWYYHEKAELLFVDDRGEEVSRIIRIGIQQFTPEHVRDQDTLEECLDCPSLLGRDILNKCIFTYSLNHTEKVVLEFLR